MDLRLPPSIARDLSRKRDPKSKRLDSPSEKRSRSEGHARLRVWKGLDFIKSEAVGEPLYLYLTKGSTLSKRTGLPRRRGKSILHNDNFFRNWFTMSLPVIDQCWIMKHFYASHLTLR